jgi:dimethylamine/trimethylamine dehydrogenase
VVTASSLSAQSIAARPVIEHPLNYGQTRAQFNRAEAGRPASRMARNSRYDILFEPVKIGPVTSRNRFYAVPHAAGMTNAMPHMRAAFRGIKAQGGWGVVCTGYVSIDPSSDDAPLPYATLWDEDDVRSHALMTEAVHAEGALAGIELWHGGGSVMNRSSRLPPLSPSGTGWMATHVNFMGNQRPKVMELQDIRQLLTWQADAARRARRAGFDIIYVYAGMGYLPYEFLLPEWNQRTDAYGGSVANRVRLVRELLEVTHEAVEGHCAVALRISLEELRARPSAVAASEAHEVVALLAELPDLWDVKLDSSPTDCAPSRFAPEGSHEAVIDFVKKLTTKPVVGVGRFTSPDTMVGQIRRGVLDLIGAARPSIADPFLPLKIDEGREQEIRECIGCNICISSWHDSVPVRCTQNPTIGEEWRRGWHPERVAPAASAASVLIVGAGPSGLECALTLGRRGYEVTVAEAADDIGGRLRFETRLPGLGAWGRVLDWRRGQLARLSNVNIYRGNRLAAEDILELGNRHVVIATGARWARLLYSPLEVPYGRLEGPNVYTPDDLAEGARLEGPVAVYDFDHYYMGSVLAEHLARGGLEVRYVTPAGHASAWGVMSNEQPQVHRALAASGVALHTLTRVTAFERGELLLAQQFTNVESRWPCKALVIVGARFANDFLHAALQGRPDDLRRAGISSVTRIGDALAPGALVHAVYSGHRYARELEQDPQTAGTRRDAPLRTADPAPAAPPPV